MMTWGKAVLLAPEESKRIGHWVHRGRVQLSLSRRELAQQMGYRNLDKGCSRLADWEAGRDVPRGDRVEVLCRALGQELGELQVLLNDFSAAVAQQEAAAEQEQLRRQAVDLAALKLLTKHHRLLLDHAKTILEDPFLAAIRVPAVSIQLAYLGARSLRLGELLGGWLEGSLVIFEESGDLYVLRVAGSPLSGRGQVLGVSEGVEDFQARGLTALQGRLGSLLKSAHRGPLEETGWSLSQLIADLGEPVEDAVLHDQSGKELGRYQHRERQFVNASGAHDLSVWLNQKTGRPFGDWHPQWKSTGKGLTIGQLSPLRRGVWRGDSFQIADAEGRIWKALSGRLEGPRPQLRYRLSAHFPPAVLAWWVSHWTADAFGGMETQQGEE